ncbi:hypothetical protein PCS78_25195 (plasmid) [Escherichia coli]|nr:hypothetical protein PCS78_25195 [Escherichia coli]
MSIKNDGHYFCRAGGNRPDGLNEPVTRDNTTFPVADYYPHLPVFVTKTPGAGKPVNYYSYAPAGPEWEFPLADAEQSWRIETCLKLWQPTVFNTPNKV